MNEPWISNPGMVGGILGSTMGILGGIVGTLASVFIPKGKAKKKEDWETLISLQGEIKKITIGVNLGVLSFRRLG